MNDRKVNQYNQQEKKEGLANKVKSKEERKKFVDYVEIHSLYFSLFSDSVTLSLRSLTHFPTLLVFLLSPHTI